MTATLRITRSLHNGQSYDDVSLEVFGTPAPWQMISPGSRAALDSLGVNEFLIQLGTSPPMTMAEIVEGLRELERLRAALPRTADGVTVVPGMKVYLPSGEEDEVVKVSASTRQRHFLSDVYSTREAAERAGKS